MGFRFRRRLKLLPGVHLNIGKRGITSISAGPRGARITAGKYGMRGTVGAPGTGLSYTAHHAQKTKPGQTKAHAPLTKISAANHAFWIAVALAILAAFTAHSGVNFVWLMTMTALGLLMRNLYRRARAHGDGKHWRRIGAVLAAAIVMSVTGSLIAAP